MSKGKIQDDTLISAGISVAEWKKKRGRLISYDCSKPEWEEAFQLLHVRI